MQNSKLPAETWRKIIQVAIAILSAIAGFFTGAGAQAATTWLN